MKRVAWILAAVLAGCAAAPAPVDDLHRPPPLTAYAANPFAPVNLYLNANEHLGPDEAALVEYAARRLRDSGAFVRIDRGVQRWPLTLQATYRVQQGAGSWRTRLRLEPKVRVHTLVVEIFDEPESLATLELSMRSTGPDGAAVEALLEQLLAQIATRKLVPRWSAFKPEPKKKKERPPGRAA